MEKSLRLEKTHIEIKILGNLDKFLGKINIFRSEIIFFQN
jgi:hypothetical protein